MRKESFMSPAIRVCLALIITLFALVFTPILYAEEPIDAAEKALDKGDWDAAIESCSSILKANPKNAKAYHFRAFAYSEKGSIEKALSDWDEALRLDSRYGRAFGARGAIYAVQKKDYDKGIADLSKAIEFDPNTANHHSNRAACFVAKHE